MISSTSLPANEMDDELWVASTLLSAWVEERDSLMSILAGEGFREDWGKSGER